MFKDGLRHQKLTDETFELGRIGANIYLWLPLTQQIHVVRDMPSGLDVVVLPMEEVLCPR